MKLVYSRFSPKWCSNIITTNCTALFASSQKLQSDSALDLLAESVATTAHSACHQAASQWTRPFWQAPRLFLFQALEADMFRAFMWWLFLFWSTSSLSAMDSTKVLENLYWHWTFVFTPLISSEAFNCLGLTISRLQMSSKQKHTVQFFFFFMVFSFFLTSLSKN